LKKTLKTQLFSDKRRPRKTFAKESFSGVKKKKTKLLGHRDRIR